MEAPICASMRGKIKRLGLLARDREIVHVVSCYCLFVDQSHARLDLACTSEHCSTNSTYLAGGKLSHMEGSHMQRKLSLTRTWNPGYILRFTEELVLRQDKFLGTRKEMVGLNLMKMLKKGLWSSCCRTVRPYVCSSGRKDKVVAGYFYFMHGSRKGRHRCAHICLDGSLQSSVAGSIKYLPIAMGVSVAVNSRTPNQSLEGFIGLHPIRGGANGGEGERGRSGSGR